MVFLLSDVFLLLTQVLLWIVVGLVVWYVLLRVLPRAFLGMLVLLLILAILALSFVQGPPIDNGVLEALWRIIAFPFTPLGLVIILSALLLSGRKLTKAAKNAMLIALVLLALGTLPIVSYTIAQELEMEGIELIRPFTALPGGARRVIVVLAHETTRAQLQPLREPPPQPAPTVDRPLGAEAVQVLSQLPVQLTEKGDVLTYAAQLYQQEAAAGTNPLLVVSAGPRRDRDRRDGESSEDASEARDAQRYLTTLGVPAANIVTDNGGTTARRSAESVRRLLSDQGIPFGNQIVLVGSALNINRAALTYANIFSDSAIFARPADFYTLPPTDRLRTQVRDRDLTRRPIQVTDLVPSADSFCLASKAFEEYLTSFYYFLRGWIRPLRPALTPL